MNETVRRGSLELRARDDTEGNYTVYVVCEGKEYMIARVSDMREAFVSTGAVSSEVYDIAYSDGYRAGANVPLRLGRWWNRLRHPRPWTPWYMMKS